MSTQGISTLSLDQQREMLQNSEALSALSLDEALELATQVTEKLSAAVLAAEEAGDFREAAELCDEIAGGWKNATAVLPAAMRPHLESLVSYWVGRADEAHQQAVAAEKVVSEEAGRSWSPRYKAFEARRRVRLSDKITIKRPPSGIRHEKRKTIKRPPGEAPPRSNE